MKFWTSVIYFENGKFFKGKGFGARLDRGGEGVFNTAMAGYQEVLTDPSYLQQVVVFGGTQVGNTGVNFEDVESKGLSLSGIVAREYCVNPSNWRSQKTLHHYLDENGVCGISEVDTRFLTQMIRDQGSLRCVIFEVNPNESDEKILEKGRAKIDAIPSMEGLELVSRVSTKQPYRFRSEGTARRYRSIVYDFGVKTNILRMLDQHGFDVEVVPYNFPFEEVIKRNPHVVLLSNGPGDPQMVVGAVEQIKGLIGRIPIMAICMGHQLLARALGAKTYKLKFGHHGVNHPVLDKINNKILVTSQNHGFAVQEQDLLALDCMVSHVNLNDGTVEGFFSKKLNLTSIQYHPESCPGPRDASYLFDQFLRGSIQ